MLAYIHYFYRKYFLENRTRAHVEYAQLCLFMQCNIYNNEELVITKVIKIEQLINQ